MENSESGTCILVMIGLPGSGKTHFSLKLSESLEHFNIVHVCYDDLIPLEKQKQLISEEGAWKSEREKIVEAVDMMMSDESEVETENKFYKQLKEKTKSGKEKTLFIIDDNNYLQSMRYVYYQLARKHTTGFAQLFLSCPVLTAQKVNNTRSEAERVPDDVIETMNEKLEAPNPMKNSWEAFSFTINVDESPGDSYNNEVLEAVIESALKNPVEKVESSVTEEEREHDRVVCNSSIVHQADKLLRMIVNKRMLSLKQSGLSKDEMNKASKHIYSVKTELLEDLKTGFTRLDKDIVDSIHSSDPAGRDKLEDCLTKIFQSKLCLKEKNT